MWCDALGAEHPLVTTSKTVKLPPPVRGNTAVQKRARKSPFARDGRSASLEPLSERNDNPGEEVPAKGPINKTRSTQSLRLRDEPRHASVALAVWGQWPAHRGRQQQSTGAPVATPRCRWRTGSGNSSLPADTGWQLQAAGATAHRPPGRQRAAAGAPRLPADRGDGGQFPLY